MLHVQYLEQQDWEEAAQHLSLERDESEFSVLAHTVIVSTNPDGVERDIAHRDRVVENLVDTIALHHHRFGDLQIAPGWLAPSYGVERSLASILFLGRDYEVGSPDLEADVRALRYVSSPKNHRDPRAANC